LDSSTNKLRSTKAILDALIAKLAAVRLDDQGDALAFERVELFDLSDYQDAMRRLALSEQRLALVIWSGDGYENERQLTVLQTRRTLSVDIFVSVRRLDDPVAAMTGDDTEPGTLALRDKVIAAVYGVILEGDDDQEAIYAVPQSVERGILNADDKKENPGRQILILNLQLAGEYLETAVGSNPSY
jgi:hypothetical protein